MASIAGVNANGEPKKQQVRITVITSLLPYDNCVCFLIFFTMINALVICMYAHPLPIHGGEMQGIPGDIGGNSMSIPPEICPGVGDLPRFSVTILIAPRHCSTTTHTWGLSLATVS